ncbi:MAG: MarR family transcriptional regulator [Sphingomonas ursincola]|nr:MarR family transcriptional regulator [Sphingomonas ursincola]
MVDKRLLGDPGTPAFQVTSYPFYLINRLASRYNAAIEAILREIELDIPSWRVLMILGEETPRGVRSIAAAAVIPLSTMTRIVQRMAAAGLVHSAPSARDARVTEVSLTTEGEEKLALARKATSPIYHKVIRDLSAEDFGQLIGLLNRLYDNLGDG